MNGTRETLTTESATLLTTLAQHRAFLRQTVRDLDDEQAARRTTASALCLGGLIKHVAHVERGWADFIVNGSDAMAWGEAEGADEFRLVEGVASPGVEGETLGGVLQE